MLLFFYTLLLLIKVKAEKPICRMMGDPKYPLFSKDGDVTIGALFPIRSIETLPSFEFTLKPQLLSCSRFATFNFLKNNTEDNAFNMIIYFCCNECL